MPSNPFAVFAAGLYRGSIIGPVSDSAPPGPVPAPRRPDRPTTLPAYENVRMATSTTTSSSSGGGEGGELVLRRGRPSAAATGDQRVSSLVILSPFNEQEEWNKVYDIVASYGDGIMSEIDQELQNRRGESPVEMRCGLVMCCVRRCSGENDIRGLLFFLLLLLLS